MISCGLPYGLEFAASLGRFVLLEESDRERELRAEHQRRIKGECGAEFLDRSLVTVLSQRVVTPAQVGFRGVERAWLLGRN